MGWAVWHWVVIVGAGWLVLACLLGLALGLIVRRRDLVEERRRRAAAPELEGREE